MNTRIFRLIVPLYLTLATGGLYADQQQIDQRLTELEKRVAELEQIVNQLNGKDRWKDLVIWQRVKKDMSALEIENLLGEPARVEKQIFETWYYHPTSRLHSFIWFDEGKVLGWEVPDL